MPVARREPSDFLGPPPRPERSRLTWALRTETEVGSRRHAATTHLLPPGEGAGIMARYARRRP